MSVIEDDPTADWTTTGVFRVAEGVYRIPLPLPLDGLRAVNAYALTGPDGVVLIDPGMAIPNDDGGDECRDLVLDALARLGAGIGDVRRFLVTHLHRDHYAQADLLRREFGVPVSLGAGEQPSMAAILADGPPFETQTALLRRHGDPDLAERIVAATGRIRADFADPTDWIADGADVAAGGRTLRAVATPGHTAGHLVFRDADGGLLFSGDHVLPRITPSIGFEAAPAAAPLRDFLDSLRLVRALPDTRLLPAHGPVAPSVHARVDELLAHHGHRLDAVLGVVSRVDATTATEAAGRITWTRRERTLDELDPFNRMLAVLETAAHLDVLVMQGRCTVSDADGVARYLPS